MYGALAGTVQHLPHGCEDRGAGVGFGDQAARHHMELVTVGPRVSAQKVECVLGGMSRLPRRNPLACLTTICSMTISYGFYGLAGAADSISPAGKREPPGDGCGDETRALPAQREGCPSLPDHRAWTQPRLAARSAVLRIPDSGLPNLLELIQNTRCGVYTTPSAALCN